MYVQLHKRDLPFGSIKKYKTLIYESKKIKTLHIKEQKLIVIELGGKKR